LDAIAVSSFGLFANGAAGGGITNTGMIAAGSDGTPIQFVGSGNTLTLGAGYTIGGAVDLRSIGTQYQGFTSFSAVGGDWTVSGSGSGWTVGNGATLRFVNGPTLSNTTVSGNARGLERYRTQQLEDAERHRDRRIRRYGRCHDGQQWRRRDRRIRR
jgi:hypothetical protein